MSISFLRFRSTLVVIAAGIGLAGCATPPSRDTIFVTRTSSKSPADVHQSIRQYVTQKGWLYINDNKLKGGEITQVRICDPKAAANIWSAGLQVSAMMPCGHMSIYQEGGRTKLTMLHPSFLTLLDPHPAVKELAVAVTGPYLLMMDEVTK
jgi:hypothetical protein